MSGVWKSWISILIQLLVSGELWGQEICETRNERSRDPAASNLEFPKERVPSLLRNQELYPQSEFFHV